jgi:hypothetical protein
MHVIRVRYTVYSNFHTVYFYGVLMSEIHSELSRRQHHIHVKAEISCLDEENRQKFPSLQLYCKVLTTLTQY